MTGVAAGHRTAWLHCAQWVGVALIMACAAPAALAQTLRGTVMEDSTRRPIENAVVTLLNNRGVEVDGKAPVRTDSAGRFLLHIGEQGRYQLRVTRLGFQPVVTPVVNLIVGQLSTLEVALSPVATRLGAVVISENRRLNNLELMSPMGFDLRFSKGAGKFMTADDLDIYKRQPFDWVLAENRILFGLEITVDNRGFDQIRMVRGANFCSPEVWIDGFLYESNRAMPRLSGLGSDEIYGVEVYSGTMLPGPSMGGEIGSTGALLRPSQRCGALAVWTKRFAEEMKAKEAVRKK